MRTHEKSTRAFIDAIDGDVARVIAEGIAISLPRSALPVGATEGQWMEWTTRIIPPPAETSHTEEERRRMSKDDDGGDIKL